MLKRIIKTSNYNKHKMFLDILQNYKIPALVELNSSGCQTITYFCDTIPNELFNATETIAEV